MQSLIHGNFEGAAQKQVYALVGASAAIAAAVGPLLGGFITTYLSWRVGFLLEAVIIAVVLSGIGRCRTCPYTGPRGIDVVGAVLSVLGMGGIVLGILVWQEGGESVGALLRRSAPSRWRALVYWLRAAQARGQADAARPGPVHVPSLPDRHLPADAAADRARRRDDRAADLPADGARVRRHAGRPVARAAVAQHVRGRRAGRRRRPASGGRAASSASGFALLADRDGRR